ncbi:carbohydrate binding domain-containing protein [Herpetosiphon giganteus]|uniref:carbohydrate binding domain-containing protein n=1 Tax=Herpetosiphon giganteus TaxID=2029754 RepID=UPI00195CD4CD|nr:carbohydrate binding domain-containing protein [Herpetosiphon giganteus]MBM7842716.1 hypothetical protein [Herpetosiphon giganteus]
MHGGGRIFGMVGLLALMFNLIGMPLSSTSAQNRKLRQLTIAPAGFPKTLVNQLETIPLNDIPKLASAKSISVADSRSSEEWIFFSITPLSADGSKIDPATSLDASSLAIAVNDHDKGWTIAIEPQAAFYQQVSNAPDSLLSPAAKTSLLSVQQKAVQAVNYRFPWAASNGWQLSPARPTIWHNGRAVDVGRNGGDLRVLNPANGVVTQVCYGSISVNLNIRYNDGKTFGYLHLDKASVDSSIINVGQQLPQGYVLGSVWKGYLNDSFPSCGSTASAYQSATYGHLHWVLPEGVNIVDGWTIQYPINYFERNGEHRGAGASFDSSNTNVQLELANPSFEYGFEGWFRDGPCNAVTYSDSPIDGNLYLVTNRSNTESCGSIFQDTLYPVQANHTYRLALMVRSSNGNQLSGTLALWGLGTASNDNGNTNVTTVGTNWLCLETVFKPTINYPKLRAQFYLKSMNGDYHLDNVTLREQTTPICSTMALHNPSFEQGTQGWSSSAPCYIGAGSGSAVDGNRYLEANRNGSENCHSVSQDLTYGVLGNRTYRIAVWVRSPNGVPLSGTLALWGLGISANENGTKNFTTSGSGWQCVEAVFQPKTNHSTFRAEFYLKSMGGDYNFDAVAVREQATPMCP